MASSGTTPSWTVGLILWADEAICRSTKELDLGLDSCSDNLGMAGTGRIMSCDSWTSLDRIPTPWSSAHLQETISRSLPRCSCDVSQRSKSLILPYTGSSS